jgi:hypothetical protein
MDILGSALEGITQILYDSGVQVKIFSLDDPDHGNYQLGRIDGFRIIESPPMMPPPAPERARHSVSAFIHRKLGHYGF